MRQFRADNGLREDVRLTQRTTQTQLRASTREPHRYLRLPQRAPGRVTPDGSLEREAK